MSAATAAVTDSIPPDTTTPAADPAVQVVLELDPTRVAQHPDNLRDPGRGIKELTASVAEVGVLVPLIVVPVELVPGHDFDPAVTHVAVDGNRRQAAARAAGLPLPCIVRTDLATAKETARTMAVTGLVRDGLTAAEEANAVATLFDLKYSAAAISRATGRSRTDLATARKAATLTATTADQVAAYPLTIDQLAVIAQWQQQPDAVAALIDAAAHGQIDHVAAQLSARQREQEAVAKYCTELAAAGVAIAAMEPSRYGTGPARPLAVLRPAESATGTELTVTNHAECPGHAAYVSADYYDADPAEDRPEELALTVTYLCTDAERNGHLPRYRDTPLPRPAPPDDGGGDDDAQEQARQDEARKAQRRELIRLNKEADAATQVRRQFLHQCLTAKSRHKAMAAWALQQVIHRDPTYSRWAGEHYRTPPILTEILGRDPREAAAAAPPSHHGILLWAHVACANEEDLPRDAHRAHAPHRAAYLQHLQSIGYTLAEVEQLILTNAAAVTPEQTPPAPHPQSPADITENDVTGPTAVADQALNKNPPVNHPPVNNPSPARGQTPAGDAPDGDQQQEVSAA